LHHNTVNGSGIGIDTSVQVFAQFFCISVDNTHFHKIWYFIEQWEQPRHRTYISTNEMVQNATGSVENYSWVILFGEQPLE